MNHTIVKNFEKIYTSQDESITNLTSAWESIKELHIQFELNPKSLNLELINPLDKLANHFAEILKRVILLSDEVSRQIGEMSLNVLKLCTRLIDKIYYFNTRKEAAFSFN